MSILPVLRIEESDDMSYKPRASYVTFRIDMRCNKIQYLVKTNKKAIFSAILAIILAYMVGYFQWQKIL